METENDIKKEYFKAIEKIDVTLEYLKKILKKEAEIYPDKIKECKCGNYLKIKKCKFNQGKLRKKYYFTHIWTCHRCKRIYLDEQFKVWN
jgi:hypothetical protein